MNLDAFRQAASEALEPILDETGAVLFSPASTLQPGRLYLMGYNPGGAEGKSIRDNLSTMHKRTEHDYVDEGWTRGKSKFAKGMHPFQKHAASLSIALGCDVGEALATNLIFVKSPKRHQVVRRLADVCWPVHELMMSIVKPNVVVAIGNAENVSAYASLRGRLRPKETKETTIAAGYGNWLCKGFHAEISGKRTFIAGIPHLTYYNAAPHPDVISWILEHGKLDIEP